MEYESGLERRHLQRFSVTAFAVVKTVSSGAEKVFELRTQDISSGGAFFPMDVPLPAGGKGEGNAVSFHLRHRAAP